MPKDPSMARSDTYADLRSFLRSLERTNQLVRIDAEVDPNLELAEIHRRVIAAGGPALLFERVKGSPLRAVSNLFGTRERVDMAFGSRPREFIASLAEAPRTLVPPTPARLWRNRRLLRDLFKVGLKRRSSGPVLEVCEPSPDLQKLPATVSWPRDGGPFLTLPLCQTEHPRTGESNLGIYRVQIHDKRTTGIHWQIGKGGGFHHHVAEGASEALPLNIALGGPPALLLGALAPLPENVPEVLLTSLILGERLRLARNPAGPIPLFADAECVLVGEVPPHVRFPEGPFGDHYGYYSLQHDFPVFQCRSLFRRKDAIIPLTVVGKPRQEDFYLGDYLQELLSPLFPLVMPGVIDLWSYGETGYHALSAAIVRERYRREAMVSAFRILGEGQLALTKFLLVSDQQVPLRDFRKTLEHVLARADFRTDLYIFSNLSMDTLDYAGPRLNEGSKGILLGLGPPRRNLPSVFEGALPTGIRVAAPFCPGCLVIEPSGTIQNGDLARIAAAPAFVEWPLLVLVDDAGRAAKSSINFLWTTFTRFDPARDLHARNVQTVGTHVSFEAPILIDARMKPSYPSELFADEKTCELVTRRWLEYFPKGLAAGDSARAHLDP